MDQFILISGCSGGGKSALLGELQRRGHTVIEEPGRRIVARELATVGGALPWNDMTSFAKEAIELARADRLLAASYSGLVFFDRGLIDAAAALEAATGSPQLQAVSCERYNRLVFVTPPWPEIYVNDTERRHNFTAAIEEYDRLILAFEMLDYDILILPRSTVRKRADFVLSRLSKAADAG